MNPNEFVYNGEPIPEIDKTVHRDFLLNLQKAMLLSLVERKLLTKSQADQVLNIVTLQPRQQ